MSVLIGKQYTMDKLISFGPAGLDVAPFVEIKKTLIARARQLYGSDIDVSDASVDGQWITELSLLINNTLQVVKELYSDLDPATAQGLALDVLASFSNISRKPATASVCLITLTAPSTMNSFILYDADKFIDKNGLIWSIDESRSEYFPAKAGSSYTFTFVDAASRIMTIPLVCDTLGPIAIPANTIESFVNITSDNSALTLAQANAGNVGTNIESDAHLRARRSKSAANEAVTIVDGIQGMLLTNANIIDAKVLNHTEAVDSISSGTAVNAHTIEALIRRKYPYTYCTAENDNTDIFIANTLYNRLTPGIPCVVNTDFTSTAVSPQTGYPSNKNLEKQQLVSINGTTLSMTIKWAECNPLSPKLEITLNPLANFDMRQSAVNVINAVANYANNLELMQDLDPSALLQEIIFADPGFQGRATYYCSPIDVDIHSVHFTQKPSTFSNVGTKTATSAEYRHTYYEYASVTSATVTSYSAKSYGNASNINNATIVVKIP